MYGPIYEKSINFSLEIIKLYNHLVSQKEYIISKQVLRSGTSIGANVFEAYSGQSLRDFISKLSIALKEARESKYWLTILSSSKLVEYNYSPLLQQNDEIERILASIIITSKKNLSKNS